METGKRKRLFKGIFILGGKRLVLRTMAYSPKQAKVFMVQRIAEEKRGTNVRNLMRLFDGNSDNYVIEEEV